MLHPLFLLQADPNLHRDEYHRTAALDWYQSCRFDPYSHKVTAENFGGIAKWDFILLRILSHCFFQNVILVWMSCWRLAPYAKGGALAAKSKLKLSQVWSCSSFSPDPVRALDISQGKIGLFGGAGVGKTVQSIATNMRFWWTKHVIRKNA